MTNETIMKKIAELGKRATRSREDAELKKARLAEDFALKQRRIAEDIAELESALDMPEVVMEEAEAPVVPEPTMEEPVAEENVKVVVTKKGASKIDRILAKAREYQLRKHEELAQEFCKLQKIAYNENDWADIDRVRKCTTKDLEIYVADARQAVAEIEKENRQTRRQGERPFDRIIAQRRTAVERCKKAIAA